MTTIHNIVREACNKATDVSTDEGGWPDTHEIDTIATECEAAIRALLTSDAAVERACAKFDRNWNVMADLVAREPFYDDENKAMMRTEMRAALEAALTPERP